MPDSDPRLQVCCLQILTPVLAYCFSPISSLLARDENRPSPFSTLEARSRDLNRGSLWPWADCLDIRYPHTRTLLCVVKEPSTCGCGPVCANDQGNPDWTERSSTGEASFHRAVDETTRGWTTGSRDQSFRCLQPKAKPAVAATPLNSFRYRGREAG